MFRTRSKIPNLIEELLSTSYQCVSSSSNCIGKKLKVSLVLDCGVKYGFQNCMTSDMDEIAKRGLCISQ
jgi:hypothetical protein